MGTRLLVLSAEQPCLSGAGAFEVYLWIGRTLLDEFESSGEEGRVGGSDPAVEVDVDNSMATGNEVV